MKICLAQTKPVTGNVVENIKRHQQCIELASTNAADLIIFPELSLTGYEPELAGKLATTLNDKRFDTFQQLSDVHGITIGAGMPLLSTNGITISMIIFQPGANRQMYAKQYLHEDEVPYFVPGTPTIQLLGKQDDIGLAICYEISVGAHAEQLRTMGAKVYLASVAKFQSGIETAYERMSEIARSYNIFTMMSNCVGINDGAECAGSSAIWDHSGNNIAKMNSTDEGILCFDTVDRHIIQQYI